MARAYTANELVSMARDEARIPNTGSTGSQDADILNRINEYLSSTLLGLVMEAKEEYFVRTTRTTLSSGTGRYRLPARAMYQKLRDLRYVENSGSSFFPIPHIVIGTIDEHFHTGDSSSSPYGYYLEGNDVVLLPEAANGLSGFLDMAFYFQPGDLVLVENARLVQSVASNVVTLTADAPSTWTASSTFDMHSPNSGAEIKAWDRSVTSVSGAAVTFTSAVDGSVAGESAVAAGDYVCLAGESALPGVPRELHPALGLAGAIAMLDEEGDFEAVASKSRRLDRLLHGTPDGKNDGALGRLRHRVEAKPKFVSGGAFISAQGRAW